MRGNWPGRDSAKGINVPSYTRMPVRLTKPSAGAKFSPTVLKYNSAPKGSFG